MWVMKSVHRGFSPLCLWTSNKKTAAEKFRRCFFLYYRLSVSQDDLDEEIVVLTESYLVLIAAVALLLL